MMRVVDFLTNVIESLGPGRLALVSTFLYVTALAIAVWKRWPLRMGILMLVFSFGPPFWLGEFTDGNPLDWLFGLLAIPTVLVISGLVAAGGRFLRRPADLRASQLKRFVALLACFLAGSGVVILWDEHARLPSGYVQVTFAGVSPKGVLLDIENKSTQTIYIRSDSGRGIWWSGVSCKPADYSSLEEDPIRIIDGFFFYSRISPGEREQMEAFSDLPAQFRDGHCQVRVELLGGSFVESEWFTPK